MLESSLKYASDLSFARLIAHITTAPTTYVSFQTFSIQAGRAAKDPELLGHDHR
jgi:hypothetical protein